MSDTSLHAFLGLVKGRHGHFLLESGHHGSLWLDLDGLFTSARRITPFVSALSDRIRKYDVQMICGPLLGGAFLAQLVARELDVPFCFTERAGPTGDSDLYRHRYVLPAVFRESVTGRPIAIVDDVISAGSALRATHAELESWGGIVAVAGALLQLGDVGAAHLERSHVPVEALAWDDYKLEIPASCPMCAAGVPLASPQSSV